MEWWDYDYFASREGFPVELINRGSDGWELVAVNTERDSEGLIFHYHFKRKH